MSKIDTNKLLLCDDFMSIQCEGLSTGVPSYFLRMAQCNLHSIGVKPGRRIPRIMVPNGRDIQINKLKSGDVICAHDEQTGTLTTTTIQAVYEYNIDKHYGLKIEGIPEIFVSDEHLFFTNKGWVRTDELKVDDEIYHYTSKDKRSFRVKHYNPMFNSKTKNKWRNNMDYVKQGKTVSATRLRMFKNGELRADAHILKEKDPERYNAIMKQYSDRMKINNPMFNPEVVRSSEGAHSLNSTKFGGYHSKTERGFHDICKANGIPLQYVGNYEVAISVNGGRRHIYPDFILPGTNKVYEIYRSAPVGKSIKFCKSSDYKEKRMKLYKDAGYDCVFIDYTLMNNDDILDAVQSSILATNGKRVLKIRKYAASKYPNLYKPLKCYDITCSPHNTFIVDGLVTHNCGMSINFLNQLRKDKKIADGELFVGDLEKQGLATWTCDSTSQWALRGEEKEFQYVIDRWKEQNLYEDIKSGLIHAIWTGGEPTIPAHQQSICNFTDYWFDYEKQNGTMGFYEIETNGSFYIEPKLFDYLDQINCSPKLADSGMDIKKRIVPAAINRIMEHKNYQFKFVISSEDDIKEMFRDYIEPFNIPLQNVCCMPGLVDREQFHERTRFVLEMAKKYRFRGLTRLHISAWDKAVSV